MKTALTVLVPCICLSGDLQGDNIRYEIVPIEFGQAEAYPDFQWLTGFIETDGTFGVFDVGGPHSPHDFVDFEVTLSSPFAVPDSCWAYCEPYTIEMGVRSHGGRVLATQRGLYVQEEVYTDSDGRSSFGDGIEFYDGCCSSEGPDFSIYFSAGHGVDYGTGFDAWVATNGFQPNPSSPALIAVRSSGVAGDANGDGIVDFADFIMLSKTFGLEADHVPTDFDDNGVVDFSDFVMLSGSYGGATSQAVPEPRTFTVLWAIVSFILWRQRGRKLNPPSHAPATSPHVILATSQLRI